MGASHWAFPAAILRRQGADVEGPALRELPHDVVLGERLLTRLSASRVIPEDGSLRYGRLPPPFSPSPVPSHGKADPWLR